MLLDDFHSWALYLGYISLTAPTSSSDEESPAQITKSQPPEKDKGMKYLQLVLFIF